MIMPVDAERAIITSLRQPGPPQGRAFRYDPMRDRKTTRYSDNLTFAKLSTYLNAGDQGDIATTLGLAEEMEAKDAELGHVIRTRRGHLTGKPWSIEPTEGLENDAWAKTAADYCNRVLSDLPSFSVALDYLARAIGPNLSATEIVWHRSRPVEFRSVPAQRMTMDLQLSTDIRIIDDDNTQGYVPEPNKFIFHIPEPQPVTPFSCTLFRCTAKLWMIANGNLADWATYNERFGMPTRLGRYPKGASSADKNALLDGLAALGTDSYGAFEAGWEIEMVEAAGRASHPFGDLDERCCRAMRKLYLGASLTTDTTGGTGTFAAAEIHNQVRADLQASDARAEDFTLREQLLRPMVDFKFPGKGYPIPHMKRRLGKSGDLVQVATKLSTAAAMGLPISLSHAYEALDIPQPEPNEELLVVPAPAPMGGGF